METLANLRLQTSNYIKFHWNNGGASEFDTSINDISRAKIMAMKNECGDCWLFKINRYPEDAGKPYLVQYTGQKIFNFEYAGIIPFFDPELKRLLINYKRHSGFKSKKIMHKLEKIQERITELNGHNLFWS